MDDLLEQILANGSTSDESVNTIWVRCNDDLSNIAQYSEKEVSKPELKTPSEAYFYGLFREQVKELKFFYGQTKLMLEIDYSVEEKKLIQHRLNTILDAIVESFAGTRPYFWESINSEHDKEAEAAIFALSCFAIDSDVHKDSSLLFETFASCSGKKLAYFASAFKNSLGKGIKRKLQQVMNANNRPEIKRTCEAIIDYRTERNAFSCE